MKGMGKGVVIAATMATLAAAGFISTVNAADTNATQVKCKGINSCRGKSECKTSTDSCKGKNKCKGEGFLLKKNAKECKAAGGTVVQDSQ